MLGFSSGRLCLLFQAAAGCRRLICLRLRVVVGIPVAVALERGLLQLLGFRSRYSRIGRILDFIRSVGYQSKGLIEMDNLNVSKRAGQ